MDSVKDGLANAKTPPASTDTSFRTRLLVADIFVPITAFFAIQGGIAFVGFVTIILGVAAWEFWRIFQKGNYAPSLSVLLVFSTSAVIMRYLWGLQYFEIWLGALLFVSLFMHVLQQQRGNEKAASNLALTVFGALYLGFLGSYAISVRFLEQGLYWVMLVFPIISLADTGAYIFGRLFGKHKMLTVVSPKKSWEGYIGGIVVGALGGWGLAALWQIASPAVLPIHGLILGFAISVIGPFGDFGESMIKRQFNIKDSSNLLPGHGGFFDRIDSSLWAAILGYYLILIIR
jgi:phosphatidate cytidylyltransferase